MWSIIIVLALLIPLVAVILDSPPAKALASRLERQIGGDSGLQERVAALESEVDRLARDLERVSEESRFLQRLLEGRREPGALGAGERDERGAGQPTRHGEDPGVHLPPGERRG